MSCFAGGSENDSLRNFLILRTWIFSAAFFLIGLQLPIISVVTLWATFISLIFFFRSGIHVDVILRVALVATFSVVYYLSLVFLCGAAHRDLIWMFGVPAAYLLGYYTFQSAQYPERLIGAFALGFSLYALLTTLIANISDYGLSGIMSVRLERAAPPLWTPEARNIYATALGIQISLGICLVGVFFVKMSALFRWSLGVFVVLSIATNFLLQNRSPVYAGLLVLMLSWLIHVYYFRGVRIIFAGFSVMLLLAILVVGYGDELGVLVDTGEALSRFSDKESGALSTPRYELWWLVAGQLFTHPFGGGAMNLSGNFYAHNVWLDVANLGGVIAAVSLFIFHLMHIPDLVVVVLRRNKVSFWVLGVFVSVCVSLVFEPVPLVSTLFFVMTFVLFGGVAGLRRGAHQAM